MTMKITRIESIWLDEQPNTTWVRLHTDDGLIGLGETFYVPRAISARRAGRARVGSSTAPARRPSMLSMMTDVGSVMGPR